MPVWLMLYLVGMLCTILLLIHEFRKLGITLDNKKKTKFIIPNNTIKPRYSYQKKLVIWVREIM